MAILAPSWPILAATCCQLGPSCVHLGSIFAPTSPKISTRSRQKSQEVPPETPRPPRGSPEGSRTAPGTRIFMVWGSISDLIFHFFLQSLLQFFWRLREWVTSNLRRLFIDLETFSPTSQSSIEFHYNLQQSFSQLRQARHVVKTYFYQGNTFSLRRGKNKQSCMY